MSDFPANSLVAIFRGVFFKSKKQIDKKLKNFKNREEIKNYLQNTLANEILKNELEIREEFNRVKCANCGKCCAFVMSEFSYETLKLKAQNNDKTSKSFLEVFVEYAPDEIPKEFKEISKGANHCYHCKLPIKKGEKYFCPIYDKRPAVCRNFPDTPLENLPEGCAYSEWKENNELKALFIKALNDIRKFYLNELA